ncbi:HEAT repeat domain-containing protein [Streptomyces hundungensis]|uniref:HEAT repeat domain-containing protein n=1 Tax=Streptomyces hundungensis TaxID=1077946 RepID=UPI0033E1E745
MTPLLATAVDALSGDAKSRFAEALLHLHTVGGAEADRAVMRFVHRMSVIGRVDELYAPELHGLAIRVAAELNPDREVEPFLGFLSPAPTRPSGRLMRTVFRGAPVERRATPAHHDTRPRSAWGYTRLRRLDPHPVARYAAQVRSTRAGHRAFAAMALGDTADLSALEPLAQALLDPSWKVRVSAVDAVRRLRHVGAANVLQGHPAQNGLVSALRAKEAPVRQAAVQALVLLERVDMVREAIALGDPAGRLEEALSQGITPLPRTWPGDRTVR